MWVFFAMRIISSYLFRYVQMCWFLWNIFIAVEWVSGGKEKKRDRKRKRKLASQLSGPLFYFWKSQNKVELNANYIKANRHQHHPHHQRYSKYCRGTLMLATCQGDHGFWIPFHLPGFRNLKFIWSMCQFLILSTKWFDYNYIKRAAHARF